MASSLLDGAQLSSSCWKKEPGRSLITKLRVIQLLEADINYAFRLLWGKCLVHHALAQNALTPLNFGGRPGCRGHSALQLKHSHMTTSDILLSTPLSFTTTPRLALTGTYPP